MKISIALNIPRLSVIFFGRWPPRPANPGGQSFALTDFREDLTKVSVPALVIHGDADGVVPFEGSGKRIHETLTGSELVLISGGPHGINVSHADEFNRALIGFLAR